MSKIAMVIHGAWRNFRSWAGFAERLRSRGHTVIAPDLQLDARDPADPLRDHLPRSLSCFIRR
jgi:hypothetical protein